MREVTMWVADDGTEFALREACELYEWEQKFRDAKDELLFFDKNFKLCDYEESYYIITKTQKARKVLREYCDAKSYAGPWESFYHFAKDCFPVDEVFCWVWDEEQEVWVSLNYIQEQCKIIQGICGKLTAFLE